MTHSIRQLVYGNGQFLRGVGVQPPPNPATALFSYATGFESVTSIITTKTGPVFHYAATQRSKSTALCRGRGEGASTSSSDRHMEGITPKISINHRYQLNANGEVSHSEPIITLPNIKIRHKRLLLCSGFGEEEENEGFLVNSK